MMKLDSVYFTADDGDRQVVFSINQEGIIIDIVKDGECVATLSNTWDEFNEFIEAKLDLLK